MPLCTCGAVTLGPHHIMYVFMTSAKNLGFKSRKQSTLGFCLLLSFL